MCTNVDESGNTDICVIARYSKTLSSSKHKPHFATTACIWAALRKKIKTFLGFRKKKKKETKEKYCVWANVFVKFFYVPVLDHIFWYLWNTCCIPLYVLFNTISNTMFSLVQYFWKNWYIHFYFEHCIFLNHLPRKDILLKWKKLHAEKFICRNK